MKSPQRFAGRPSRSGERAPTLPTAPPRRTFAPHSPPLATPRVHARTIDTRAADHIRRGPFARRRARRVEREEGTKAIAGPILAGVRGRSPASNDSGPLGGGGAARAARHSEAC